MYLYGKPLAEKIICDLARRKKPEGALAVLMVGGNPVSRLYVAKKSEVASRLKIDFRVVGLKESASEYELENDIAKLNGDSKVRGIILQLPLPRQIDRRKAVSQIAPNKDIDGFHCILDESSNCSPPTIVAIDELLRHYKIGLKGKKILIVGRGFLVGKPLEKFWEKKGYSVESLEKDSPCYEAKLKSSGIVVVATGGGRVFRSDDFAEGAVVVDATTVADEDRIHGDVDKASWPDDRYLAPVPGGVGPVTVAALFRNFYDIIP